MSLYKMFGADDHMETEGILVNYGDTRFRLARAGGANEKFAKVFREKSKPFRWAIDNNRMSEEDTKRLMAEVYAESVVLGWESAVRDEDGELVLDENGDPKIKPEIEDAEGNLMPFTVENCVKLLVDLPDLLRDLQTYANRAANFRKEEDDVDMGNFAGS